MLNIDVGVFAYNEENNIKKIIEAINSQDIFNYKTEISVNVFILANGCTDNTVEIAKSLITNEALVNFELINFDIGGKSRTWNRFVHEFSRTDADHLIFCDSDIWFTNNSIFRRLVEHINNNPMLSAVSSRPIKDLTIAKDNLTLSNKAIAASGDGLNNWKKSICGQLYILKAMVARTIYLPIGLPVEDGYVRAMITTENMTKNEDLSKISGDENIFHLYRSERTIKALINHQTRIVIGSAINYQIFNELRRLNLFHNEMLVYTKSLSENEYWLTKLIQTKLPSRYYGWVPWHFLVKRLKYSFSHSQNILKPKKIFILILGFGFDLIVFVKAQYKMLRGNGVGYW